VKGEKRFVTDVGEGPMITDRIHRRGSGKETSALHRLRTSDANRTGKRKKKMRRRLEEITDKMEENLPRGKPQHLSAFNRTTREQGEGVTHFAGARGRGYVQKRGSKNRMGGTPDAEESPRNQVKKRVVS